MTTHTTHPDDQAAWIAEADWLRTQFQMAHHDIWWVKGQQMNAGNWTLLLLGALVGLGHLMGYGTDATKVGIGRVLGGLGVPVTFVGGWYVWDLFRSLVRSRRRATRIIGPLRHSAFDEAKSDPIRLTWLFPLIITLILVVALALVQWYFGNLSWLAAARAPTPTTAAATPTTAAASWEQFFDAGGVAGMLALAWQAVKEIRIWRRRPRLHIRPIVPSRDLRAWTLLTPAGQRQQKVFTLEIANTGRRGAKVCVAVFVVQRQPAGVNLPETKFTLHWAGIDYSLATTGSQPVDIAAGEDRRLDVAFTVDGQTVPGCWVAVPIALSLPPAAGQAHLPPGDYEGEVSVTSDDGATDTVKVRIQSPKHWNALDASVVA